MKVYHMSQTLKPGDTLHPDYKRCTDLAMPFARALERSEDCFYAMVFGAQIGTLPGSGPPSRFWSC